MQRANSLEKIQMLENTEDKRRRGQQSMRLLNGVIDSMNMNLSTLREIVKDSKVWHAAVQGSQRVKHE